MNEYVRLEEVTKIIEEQIRKRNCLEMGGTDRTVLNVLQVVKTRIWKLDIVEAEPVRHGGGMMGKLIKCDYDDTGNITCVTINNGGKDVEYEPITHGWWIPFSDHMWSCSNCRVMGSPQWKRCPVCEAKMDGGAEDD